MSENVKIIEDKIDELIKAFNAHDENVRKLERDIQQYTIAKDTLKNEMLVVKGAIDAYRATVELLKGKMPSEPQTVDGSVVTSG